MLVLGVNKWHNWCQIIFNGSRYTCPTKIVNGKLHFKFKKIWYPVAEFIADNAEELINEGGKIFSRPFKD